MMVDESEHGQSARTRYRVIDRAGNSAAWVELQPLTGRTHQLRVHMAAIGHPIVGDGKYGGPEAFLTGSISRKMHLHARRLIIDHPDGTPLDVTAPLPGHFAASMAQLGFSEVDGDDLAEAPALPEREAKKQAAKAHAKQYRKERRGERRGRKSGERGPAGQSVASPLAKKANTKKPGAKKPITARKAAPAGKAAFDGKPASARKSAGVAGKPSSVRKPSPKTPTQKPPGKR
jgi:23S rRNA pseudouridine955/2504/2580 synthase